MPKSPTQAELEAEYQLFVQSIENYFSSVDAKKAPVLDGSGALSTGEILDFVESLPATMTGDAWESAANFILAQRNAGPWRKVADFLDSQHLESLGLRRLPARVS